MSYPEENVTDSEQNLSKCGQLDVRRQMFIGICLNIGHIIVGYSLCWPAPVFQKLQDPERTPLDRPMNDAQATWLAACFHLATLTGTQVTGFLCNVIGRKLTLMLCAAVIFGSNVVMLVAANFATLFVGRILLGLGAGGITTCDLVYIGEIASSHLRGIILTSTAVLHNIGGLLVFSVGPYVSYSIVQYILFVLTILYLSGLFYIPESPVYHVIKGNEQDARDALNYLGRSKDIDSELKTMIENSKERRTLYSEINKTRPILPKWGWLDVFRRRRNRRALAITGFLMAVQEGAGVICIISFATSIFQKARSSINPNVSTIILGVTQVCGVVIAPFLVEKFGRKALLLFSTIICALCMALLAVDFYLELIAHPIQASIRWLPLASLIVFLLGYSSGLGVIPNVLVGELFSLDARSIGSSFAMGVCCLTGFVISLTYGFIIMAIGSHIVFTLFTVMNVLGCIVTVIFVPETKGMSLTEIEAMLAR